MADEQTIYIGNKPVMSYVLAAMAQLNESDGKIVLKARGRAIGRAVDVAEVLKNRFMPNVSVKDIKVDTEELSSEQGRRMNVSTIEISLLKQ
ncbi:MAG TPA: DNA-binding protein Alba [Archaeoglobaceae archaeon]|nr:DNA-binding protein Alba [Archaeoglobaceae archaeon]